MRVVEYQTFLKRWTQQLQDRLIQMCHWLSNAHPLNKAMLPTFETAVFREITNENRRNAGLRSTRAESQRIGEIKSRSTWYGILKVAQGPLWYAGC